MSKLKTAICFICHFKIGRHDASRYQETFGKYTTQYAHLKCWQEKIDNEIPF